MTRHFFSEGAQERYSQARMDAIRTMGRIAKDESCQFLLVCGDAFESNQVDRKTVARAARLTDALLWFTTPRASALETRECLENRTSCDESEG